MRWGTQLARRAAPCVTKLFGELLRSPTRRPSASGSAPESATRTSRCCSSATQADRWRWRFMSASSRHSGAGAGTGVAVGLNRPEVLMIIGAGQAAVIGFRAPLGSLADPPC